MTMLVVECNICGEPLAAATDEELLRRFREHLESEHEGSAYDEEAARRTIATEAYHAADS
jgi:predicted small metal-binding protein